jgi:hypothetical protein
VLGKVQPRSDFLVGKPPTDQFHKLLFATAEFLAAARTQVLLDGELLCGATKQGH